MAPFKIGRRRFPHKKDAIEFIRSILHSAEIGQPLVDEDETLRELVACHPRAAEKKGKGIRHFTVENAGGYTSRHFTLHRIDGSHTDFSYRRCLMAPSHRNDVLHALRSLVADQIISFRDKLFQQPVTCPLTGKDLTIETCHIDHVYPTTFSYLVSDFCTHKGIDLDTIVLKPSQDNEQTCYLEDEVLAKEWAWYHLIYAELRAIDKEENQRLSNKEN